MTETFQQMHIPYVIVAVVVVVVVVVVVIDLPS